MFVGPRRNEHELVGRRRRLDFERDHRSFYLLEHDCELECRLLDFELLDFELLDFELLDFELLDFELLDFELLDFELLDFEFIDFEFIEWQFLDFEFVEWKFLEFHRELLERQFELIDFVEFVEHFDFVLELVELVELDEFVLELVERWQPLCSGRLPTARCLPHRGYLQPGDGDVLEPHGRRRYVVQ